MRQVGLWVLWVAIVTVAAVAMADDGASVAAKAGQDESRATSSESLKAIVEQWRTDRQADKPTDAAAYLQRILTIAQRQPTSEAGRDAALWIVAERQGPGVFTGAAADIERQAVEILVTHHADDLRVVRACCNLDNKLSPNSESLVVGVLNYARDPQAQGLVRIGMAKYLRRKADTADRLARESGNAKSDANPSPWETYAGKCDVAAARARAEQLLEEVVDNYGTIAFQYVRSNTLGDIATAFLDDMRNLAVGKPAPEIDGLDLDGHPLKLSDHRGKVVLLVFWATWCGPCMAAIPEELAVYERFKTRPFVVVGIDGDNDLDAARQAVTDHKIPWANWRDTFREEDGFGLIRDRYHVYGIPRLFLLDADGNIRVRDANMGELDERIAELLDELDVKTAQSETRK